jgi:hypothetical protein
VRISAFPSSAILLLGGTAFALGCAVEPVEYTADADTGSTHALVSVERSTLVNADEAPRAEALAGFVRVPAVVDPGSVLNLVGLGLELPPAGQCASRAPNSEGRPALSPLGHVEFLDAGDVALTARSSATTLAPRAFPTVTDRVSGVVYTTRDRSADQLPVGERYELRTSGGLGVPQLVVETQAPAALDGVSLGGMPLGEVETVSTSKVLDIAWTAGESGDLVYVELATEGGSTTTCTFRDELGAGSVPAGAFDRTGVGRLGVHRVRVRDFFRPPAIDRGELRFDFELVAPLRYSE